MYRVSPILKDNLPSSFKDKLFYNTLDEGSKKWLQTLIKNLNLDSVNSKSTTTNTTNTTKVQNGNFNNDPYYNSGMNSFSNYNNYEPYYYSNPYSISNPYYMYDKK